MPAIIDSLTWLSIHSNVFTKPSLSDIFGSQPSFWRMSLLSEFRPRTPSGPGMCLIRRFLPAISMTSLASALIVIISSDPMFTGPVKLDSTSRRIPSIHSSTIRKDRVCSPSPHSNISPPSDVSATLRQSAAGAFYLPPRHVPRVPKMLWKRATRTSIP